MTDTCSKMTIEPQSVVNAVSCADRLALAQRVIADQQAVIERLYLAVRDGLQLVDGPRVSTENVWQLHRDIAAQMRAAIAGMDDGPSSDPDPGPSPEHVAAVNEQVQREAAAEHDMNYP